MFGHPSASVRLLDRTSAAQRPGMRHGADRRGASMATITSLLSCWQVVTIIDRVIRGFVSTAR